MCLYPLKNNTGSLSEGADVPCELLLRYVKLPDMGAYMTESGSVRKPAFLGFSSHEMMVSVAFSSARTSAP